MSKAELDRWVGPKYFAPLGQVTIYCTDPISSQVEFNWTKLDRFHRQVICTGQDTSGSSSTVICDEAALQQFGPSQLDTNPGLRPLHRFFSDDDEDGDQADVLLRIIGHDPYINREDQAKEWDRYLRFCLKGEWLLGFKKVFQNTKQLPRLISAGSSLLAWNLNPSQNSLVRPVIDLQPRF